MNHCDVMNIEINNNLLDFVQFSVYLRGTAEFLVFLGNFQSFCNCPTAQLCSYRILFVSMKLYLCRLKN